MKRTRYLTADQIVHAHQILLERWGGDEGGGHRGASYEGVEAAMQAVKNSYYEPLVDLAAAYAVYIVQGHVFLDGNKRTGAAAMLAFLELNGSRLAMRNTRLFELMIDLQERSESGESTATLVHWLSSSLEVGAAGRPKRTR